MKTRMLVLAALVVALVSSLMGCGALPPASVPGATVAATQSTPDEEFAQLAGDTLTIANQVVLGARTLLAAGKITPADADNIATAAETAQTGVAIARDVKAKQGVTVGTARLRVAAAALNQFALYVSAKTTGAK